MAEIVAMFREGQFGVAPIKIQVAGRNSDEASDHPQKGRFSGAVATGYDHALAGG
jgi:hypothetical protein